MTNRCVPGAGQDGYCWHLLNDELPVASFKAAASRMPTVQRAGAESPEPVWLRIRSDRQSGQGFGAGVGERLQRVTWRWHAVRCPALQPLSARQRKAKCKP